jgi:hypothetical protein
MPHVLGKSINLVNVVFNGCIGGSQLLLEFSNTGLLPLDLK